MSDVLAHSSNPTDGLSSLSGGVNNSVAASNGNPRTQSAIERLKRRMDSYREMQGARLPQYDQTMNQVNSQQLNETLALRQKFLESKAKKPNKKSSSSAATANNSAEKQKMDINSPGLVAAPPPNNSTMNGMMPYHGGMGQQQQSGGGGGGMHGISGHPHQQQQMHNNANNVGSQPMMGAGGHLNHHHHGGPPQLGGGGGSGALKRPLETDDQPGGTCNTQDTSTTAKRQNLDNGATVKREPSPLESKYTPSGGSYPPPSNSSVQNHHRNNNGGHHAGVGAASASPDIKPNLSNLKEEIAAGTDSSQRSGGAPRMTLAPTRTSSRRPPRLAAGTP